jgi:hypothetical protein
MMMPRCMVRGLGTINEGHNEERERGDIPTIEFTAGGHPPVLVGRMPD